MPSAGFPPAEIETRRLRLRTPQRDDAPAAFAYGSDPEVTRFVAFPTHQSLADAERFIERGLRAWATGEGHHPWMITRRDTSEILGAIGVDLADYRVHVGYILARKHWGKGVMSEALCAVRDAAFADPRIHRFEAFHHVDNLASGRVLQKAGMRNEGVLRSYLVHPQQGSSPHDVVMWAIVRADLDDRVARLARGPCASIVDSCNRRRSTPFAARRRKATAAPQTDRRVRSRRAREASASMQAL